MSYTESQIMFETAYKGPVSFWVLDNRSAYTVMRSGITHSESVQSYARDADGLSLAIADAKYRCSRLQ